MGAVVHTNQFSVLDVEEGVDTHNDNYTLQDTTSADVDACGDVVCGCACKDSKQLQHLKNANVQATHAQGGSVKGVLVTPTKCVSGYQPRVFGKGKVYTPASKTMKACTNLVQNCLVCGKKDIGSAMCKKCANSSFAHFENQLVDGAGSVVDNDHVSNNMFTLPAEIVPLYQFSCDGKRCHYLSFGVFMLEQLIDYDVAN